ncbi:MAG: beta-glucosidase [Bacteroidales bacterium]
MKKTIILSGILVITAMVMTSLQSCKKWTEEEKQGYTLVHNRKGPVLGYSKSSGVQIITTGGYAFKDLNRNGKLDAYED